MKTYKCTNKKRFLVFTTVFILFIFSVIQLINAQTTDAQEAVQIVTIRVKEGDSLWKLADTYDNNKMDLREYIYIIQSVNDISNTILQPGQKIRIPIFD
jgi:LysM repeat protein